MHGELFESEIKLNYSAIRNTDGSETIVFQPSNCVIRFASISG